MAENNIDALSQIPLFQDLTRDEISDIDQYLDYIEFEADDTIFEEGEKGKFVCFVLNGELDVIKTSMNGSPTIIAKHNKGESIGEMALIDELPRSATLKARTHLSLTTLSRDEFEKLLIESPQIGIKILKYLARHLSISLRKTSNRLSDGLE